MVYVGIDPGKRGAYAAINGDGVEVYPWDDVFFAQHMKGLIASGEKVMAVVEKVGAMPGQGVTSMFTFGKSAGYIEGVLTALSIPYQLIPPRKWKGEFGLNADKAGSVRVCKKLFPNVRLLPTGRCRRESDGMAEALLICLYAKRHF